VNGNYKIKMRSSYEYQDKGILANTIKNQIKSIVGIKIDGIAPTIFISQTSILRRDVRPKTKAAHI